MQLAIITLGETPCSRMIVPREFKVVGRDQGGEGSELKNGEVWGDGQVLVPGMQGYSHHHITPQQNVTSSVGPLSGQSVVSPTDLPEARCRGRWLRTVSLSLSEVCSISQEKPI